MKLRENLNVSKIVGALKNVQALRPRISNSSLIKSTIIFLILLLAFGVRLLPIRWGFYLTEFDPYYQYRQTKYIVENGYLAWTKWHDYMSWYPWGNPISRTSYPGLPMTAATFYMVLNALGIRIIPQASLLDPLFSDPVYNFAVIFPVIMATAACLVMYFLGKELEGDGVGIFAAFFLALNSSYIGRTSLGWFDDESVGIFGILLFILFFMRSIDKGKPLKAGLFYAIAAGLSLGYLSISWGASRYPIAMTALFVFVLLLIRRYSTRLLLSYTITFGLTLVIAMNIPYLGYRFIFEETMLPVYGVFFLLCTAEINHRAKKLDEKIIYILVFIALLADLFIVLWLTGLIRPLQSKFLSVLNPYQRASYPLVESVAEHRSSAWGTFYYDVGVGIFFIPIGLFFAMMMGTNMSIFIIIYGLTSVYFASSMIRLTVLMSPVLCLLWALAVNRLLKPFILFLKENPQISSRKMRFKPILGKEIIGGILIMIFILFTITYVVGTDFFEGPTRAQGPRVFSQSYLPTTIASASIPVKSTVRDWLDALIWMRENTPPSPQRPGEAGTVVASWWDYGYWITAIANRTSLADNGTWNWTQIERIALMFMSNVNASVEILKKYNVTHVVVFTTIDTSGNDAPYGEYGKFKWMIRIAHLNESDFGADQSGGGWIWSGYGKNTTLYLMMTYGKYSKFPNLQTVQTAFFDTSIVNQWNNFASKFKLVFPTPEYTSQAVSGLYALVFVYEVKY